MHFQVPRMHFHVHFHVPGTSITSGQWASGDLADMLGCLGTMIHDTDKHFGWKHKIR